jgi:MSHA biogenesis protein MshM
VWKRHWKLTRDPFLAAGSPYVSTPTHDEAVARLTYAVESGQPSAVIRAGTGFGKTTVLAQALAELRGPSRRIARASRPADGPGLLVTLAEGLGDRLPARGLSRAMAWKALAERVRLCRWQGLQVVLAIDDCHALIEPADRLDLDRLTHLDPHPESRLTVLQTFQTSETLEPDLPSWELSIGLKSLTRMDIERYVAAKLASAGRAEPTFTPRALHRLHSLAGGVPRGLDRLASLSLMGAALRGLEMVTPEVVEGVSVECALGS